VKQAQSKREAGTKQAQSRHKAGTRSKQEASYKQHHSSDFSISSIQS